MINTFGLGRAGSGGGVTIYVGVADTDTEIVELSSDIGGALTSNIEDIAVVGSQISPLQGESLSSPALTSEI